MEKNDSLTTWAYGAKAMTFQPTLFDSVISDDTEDNPSQQYDLKKIAWSHSRRSTLERCVRQYYYEYFGASKRTAKQDADKEKLILLKQLQNRRERAGELLHRAIGTYFRKGREGDLWKPERLASWARDVFRKDIAFSQTYPQNVPKPDEKFPPKLLSEFYHQISDAQTLCTETVERLYNAVITFVTSATFAEFRRGGLKADALIEHRLNIGNILPCRVEGRIDLAYPRGDQVTIIDWKMGLEDGLGDESLQLAVYAMWAVEYFQCPPEMLRIGKAYLGSDTVSFFESDTQLLVAARARIFQDAERMALMEPYGRDALVEAFTPCLQPRVCRDCAFLAVCREGKELIYA